jgi:hypothetical protein
MKTLNRESIFNSTDLKSEEVYIPEWLGSVKVRGMTGEERDKYEKSVLIKKGKNIEVNLENARARLIILTTVDENGKHLFTENDLVALGHKSAAALSRIFDVAARLSGITEQDVQELTEEQQENPFADSASD